MRPVTVFIFSLVLALLPIGFAQAAGSTIVFGQRDARECYLGANLARLSAESTMPSCDRALNFQKMSRKERAATFVNRGILHTHLQEFDKALEDFDDALELVSGFAEAYLNRGNALLFLGRYELALVDYDAAIDGETHKLHAAYYNRGLAREAAKQPALAFEDFRHAAKLRPSWGLATGRVERYAGMGYSAE